LNFEVVFNLINVSLMFESDVLFVI